MANFPSNPLEFFLKLLGLLVLNPHPLMGTSSADPMGVGGRGCLPLTRRVLGVGVFR